jgi:hypothetical protein
VTEGGEPEEYQVWNWLSWAAAKPEIIRDALRQDPGLVLMLAADEGFLEGLFRSSAPLVALIDASRAMWTEDTKIDDLLIRINAGPQGVAGSPDTPGARLARELRKFAKDATRGAFSGHPELITILAGNQEFAAAVTGNHRVWEGLLKKGQERLPNDPVLRKRIQQALTTIIHFTAEGTLVNPDHAWQIPLALVEAAERGDLNSLTAELANTSINPNRGLNPDGSGWTALMCAAGNGHADCVQALLADARIDPNLGSNPDGSGWTALRCAAENGHAGCVQSLLANARIDPNRGWNPDGSGWTALMFAAETGHGDCVQAMLADPRIDPKRRNEAGITAREIARAHGNNACEVLLANAERARSKRREKPERR